jgi:hypothetical protein
MQKILLMSLGLTAAFSTHAQSTVAAWTFDNLPVAANNAPVPSTGTGTATPLGMTNGYTYSNGVTGSLAAADVLAGSNGNATREWRVRGSAAGNGWNLAAPQFTQGAQFSASTVGFGGITFSYGWTSTAQGVRNLQAQYTTDGSNWANVGPLQVASPTAYQNLSIDFAALGLVGVDNNASFGVRLVSAFDPSFGAGTSYTAATLTGGVPVAHNNQSGNWRFDNLSITAAVPETGTLAMLAVGLPLLALALRRKQT